MSVKRGATHVLSGRKFVYTVEPLNKGHLGTQAAVPYSEVVPYWEVQDKTMIFMHFYSINDVQNTSECIET